MARMIGCQPMRSPRDCMTPAQRKKAMRSNRGRTGPERALASLLWQEGFRYLTAEGYRRRYGRRLLGQPDLIFGRKRVVLFVDGCFWHGCPKCGKMPEDYGNAFWRQKVETNVSRDERITVALRRDGWKVIRVWEHDLRRKPDLERTAHRVSRRLRRKAD